ncbi:hypothetical protein FHS77_001198 [Paenochrobactrum gallinarii]|uniref:AAA+ ATPase domain-containing protein n=1 Tax=Paenochrobactrum gallinarii TaxID=643673 RepID=A0A841M531_9HYPH|nr:AAA family ATPase [Paenochrobactrum gallinarii]MBB6260664.1 hypothetical protein [Paenochrobactrum gallinarii]
MTFDNKIGGGSPEVMTMPPGSHEAVPSHDKGMARRFLEILDPNAVEFTFLLIAEGRMGASQSVHGTLDEVWPFVERNNVPGRGMGVFVTINETDGSGRRKKGNIVRARSLWVDADDRMAVERCVAAIRASGATPTAIVKSSDDKAHFYWVMDDLSLADFDRWQPVLIAKLDTDRSPKDPARVMRLPGSLHLKDPSKPCFVKMIGKASGPRWAMEFFLDLMQLDKTDTANLTIGRNLSPVFEMQGPVHSKLLGFDLAANDDLSAGVETRGWFARLPLDKQNECLREMLATCRAIANGGRDEWLRIMMAAHSSEAPAAEEITLQWCKTGGNKFTGDTDFQRDWNSFGGRGNGITVGTLIKAAEGRGFDAAPWKSMAGITKLSAPVAPHLLAVPPPFSSTAVVFSNIPHRQWLYGTDLVRGEITLLASPGGIGKSSLAIGIAVSTATGRPLLGDAIFGRELKALYVNGEDSRTEMLRRIQSFCLAHGLTEHDLSRLHLLGAGDGAVQSLSFLRSDKGASIVDLTGFVKLRALLSSIQPDVVILDPLVVFCGGGNLNDNAAMSGVLRSLKQIANEYDCAILVIHHTKKGADLGSAEAIGGASAIVNLARRALMAVAMSDDEARKLGVLPSQRGAYFRTVASKSNLSPRIDETPWYELTSVELPNPEPPTYPNGDRVQAVRRAQLSSLASLSLAPDHQAIQRAILDAVAQGKMVDGQTVPYSPSVAGANNGRSLLEDALAVATKTTAVAGQQWKPEDLQAIVEQNIKVMKGKGWLRVETIASGPARRGKGLHVNWQLTPWAREHCKASKVTNSVSDDAAKFDLNASPGASGK